MAFKSIEEFIAMYKTDPDKANALLQKAVSTGKTPISKKNAGYSKPAVVRRMKRKAMPNPRKPQRKMEYPI